MPTIAIQSACSFSPETLLRILIAGTKLRPCEATSPGVFEYGSIDMSDRLTVSKRLVDMCGRRLIVAA